MKTARLMVLIGLGIFLLPAFQGCDTALTTRLTPGPGESIPEYLVLPGTSIPFPNPIHKGDLPANYGGEGQWLPLDSFELVNPPSGLSVATTIDSQGNPTRTLSATPDVALVVRMKLDYVYTTHFNVQNLQYPVVVFDGSLLVSTGTVPPLQVSASANPATILSSTLKATSTLKVTVTGGAPPYSFSWSPGNATSAALVVTPAVTTAYSVKVTDSAGQTATASVTVTVSAPTSFTLKVDATNIGYPGVFSRPSGISFCLLTNCSRSFASGTPVVLASGQGATLGWSGCDSVDGNLAPAPPQTIRGVSCTVIMNADKAVTVYPK